jgi:hypothetical protein
LPVFDSTQFEMEMGGAGMAAFPNIAEEISGLDELPGPDSSAQ